MNVQSFVLSMALKLLVYTSLANFETKETVLAHIAGDACKLEI